MNVPVASTRVGHLVIIESCVEICVFANAQIAQPIAFEGKSISLEDGSRSHRLHRYEKNVDVRYTDLDELLHAKDFSSPVTLDMPRTKERGVREERRDRGRFVGSLTR